MTDKLDDVADRMAITELLYRYARYVHGDGVQDAEMAVSCFTEDADMVFAGGEPRRVSELGLGSMASQDPTAMRKINGLDRMDAATTATTDVSIELHGDTATVESLATTTLVGLRDGVPAIRVRGIHYSDDVVRQHGEWKISRRRHTLLWAYAATPTAPGE